MADLKPAGQAVATAKGHYPAADGRHVTILPGQTFTVWEGATKAKWFTLLKPGAPAPKKVEPPAPPAEPNTLAEVAKAERKRKAEVKPPTADDLV